MPHEHKQPKPQQADARNAVAVAPARPQNAGSYEVLPGVSSDNLRLLQGSVGNAAIGRMVRAGGVATAERPTAISPGTQAAIDSQRPDGEALGGDMQGEMESLTGADLRGVRLHSGPPADALTRGLGANAFTQGHEIFLRGDRDPTTDAGKATLTHELTHVAEGSVGRGAALLEPATADAPPAGPVPTPYPNANDGAADGSSGPGTAGPSGTADPKNLAPKGLPGLGAPMEPNMLTLPLEEGPSTEPNKPGQKWDVEYTMYGNSMVFKGLTDEELVAKLESFYMSLLDDLKNGEQRQRSWQEEFGESMSSRWTAAAASVAGGADWPDLQNWVDVAKGMADAGQLLRESRWAAMMSAGKGGEMDEWARKSAVPIDEKRVQDIVQMLEDGDRKVDKAEKDWATFLKDTDKGASRTVTGLKVAKFAGAVAATYLTGGLATGAKLGFWGTSLALGLGGGGYAMTQNLAGQAGEIMFGDRDSIDFSSVAIDGAIGFAAGFVGGAVGGKLSSTIGNGLGKMVGGMAPETMEAFGITGAQLLTNGEKLFVAWAGNTLSSPFGTAVTVLMQRGITGKWPVTSVEDFFERTLEEMAISGGLGGFFTFVHANSPTPGGGGGRGGSGSGRGSTPTPDAVPEYIGPEGDAYLSPEVSTGAVEHIGPGGDAPLSPDISIGIPEYIGPEGSRTAPQEVTGYEATQRVNQPPVVRRGGAGAGNARTLVPGEVNLGTEATQPTPVTSKPARPAGQAPQVAEPAARPMTETAAESPNSTQAEQPNRTASERTNAEESRAGSRAGDEEVPQVEREGQPTESEFNGPREFTARKALYRTDDPFEASQMFNQARANGRPAEVVQSNSQMQAHWEGATGQKTPAPVAFVDNFGQVFVDGSRGGEYFSGTDIAVPQGPVQNPGERVPDYAEMTPEPPVPGDTPMERRPAQAQPEDQGYPGVRAEENRGVIHEIPDPVAAAHRYYAERVAGRGVRTISGKVQNGPNAGQRYIDWAWQNEYGGTGDAPAAWQDGKGFLVVDADIVVLADNAGQLPQGPVQE